MPPISHGKPRSGNPGPREYRDGDGNLRRTAGDGRVRSRDPYVGGRAAGQHGATGGAAGNGAGGRGATARGDARPGDQGGTRGGASVAGGAARGDGGGTASGPNAPG